jgi:hypothetical protein
MASALVRLPILSVLRLAQLKLKNDTFSYDEIDKTVVMSVSVEREYNLKLP